MSSTTTRVGQRDGATHTSQMTISGPVIRHGTTTGQVLDRGTTTIHMIIGAAIASRIRWQVMLGESGMPLNSTKADTTGMFPARAHGYGTSSLRPLFELGEADSTLRIYEEVS